MTLIWAFIIAGVFCAVAEIVLDNTKLTPGHITSMFTVLGAILGFLGLYEKLIELGGGGASAIISNFGYLLYKGGYEGYLSDGILGIFTGLLKYGGAAIVGAIVFATVLTLFFKPKD